ncbi:D-amino acid dehydrogenase [Halomonas sp. 1513]|nr:FAD-dependent oxidoreductase [Halomonas sp. 1513]APX94452.1 D-amino acid dehydrogenase [Halomonas sp. 1513]
MQRIAVIGGGITGVTTAYALLKRGLDVTLYERHRYAAMETSFANGGQLSASNAEVWNHWPTVLKGLRWMLRADAPLLVNPKPAWHKLSWFAEFMAAIPRYADNTTETTRLAIAARDHLYQWAREEGIDFDLERRGVTTRYGHDVCDLEADGSGAWVTTAEGREAYDGVVVCAGVGSRGMAAKLGDRLNVYPVKGYSITVHLDEAASQQAAPMISLLDDEAKLVTSRLGKDRFRIAGTAEFNGFNRDIRDDRIRPLIDWVEQCFPGVSTRRVVPWAGLRPMLPNMLPRVGRGRLPSVFYNTGHGHLGWTLSAITAEMVADSVTMARPADARLSPAR